MENERETLIAEERLKRYYELIKQKKEIEQELQGLKEEFHNYLNGQFGLMGKGEVTVNGFKLQRQIRKTEKYDDAKTIDKLEALQMNDLIRIEKKADQDKIKSAITLGFLREDDLEGCIVTSYSPAITVKTVAQN